MRNLFQFGVLLVAALALNDVSQSLAADNFCGNIVEPKKALIKAIVERAPLKAFSGNSKVPTFLEGIEPQIFNGDANEHQGSVLFVRKGAGWVLIAPNDGEEDQGLFASSQSGEVFIVTMIAIEGPGSDYTLVRASEGFSKFDCLTIPFPRSIKIRTNICRWKISISTREATADSLGQRASRGAVVLKSGGFNT
jgi:hypothetical protein